MLSGEGVHGLIHQARLNLSIWSQDLYVALFRLICLMAAFEQKLQARTVMLYIASIFKDKMQDIFERHYIKQEDNYDHIVGRASAF
jgi:hypothetical protein